MLRTRNRFHAGHIRLFPYGRTMYAGKDTILFIDPGFPVQKQQIAVMGYKYESFDVYEYRGERLREALETHLSKGNIAR